MGGLGANDDVLPNDGRQLLRGYRRLPGCDHHLADGGTAVDRAFAGRGLRYRGASHHQHHRQQTCAGFPTHGRLGTHQGPGRSQTVATFPEESSAIVQ